ncbi:MAG TPA: hypothetical protein VLK25_01170 [Allosphingosinicella sp.]|nr:hypothetical protein [Allosphingosinicella sp.]
MRLWSLLILPFAAACAGNVADYVGPRGNIATPQLLRFGFDLGEARCVGEAIGDSVRPVDLRRLVRAAGAVRQGSVQAGGLTPRDLLAVAGTLRRPGVRDALERASRTCGMAPYRLAGLREPPPPVEVAAPPPAAPRTAWLNLGSGSAGQSIAIDAMTLEQSDTTRTAWFRLTDPGAPVSDSSFLLLIDCAHRTINARARQRRDAAGVVTDRVDYPDNPLPVENGTVMEIAWLALCT